MTDEEIELLIKIPKMVKNPAAREREKRRSFQRTHTLESIDGSETFELYTRQNSMDPESYSCGLVYHAKDGEKTTLVRYNGSCHQHRNPLEDGQTINYACHIHRATQRYISAGLKSDHFAEQTDRYNSMNEALVCILQDCNISGLDDAEARNSDQNQLPLEF